MVQITKSVCVSVNESFSKHNKLNIVCLSQLSNLKLVCKEVWLVVTGNYCFWCGIIIFSVFYMKKIDLVTNNSRMLRDTMFNSIVLRSDIANNLY